ncbi:MAG: PilZ domain-containing protein [Magnetococcales bacterium]|nr:PilZ domain-containing protein [Magnetococcales bacterium]
MTTIHAEEIRDALYSSILEISQGIQKLAGRMESASPGRSEQAAALLQERRPLLEELSQQASGLIEMLGKLDLAAIANSEPAMQRLQVMEREAFELLNLFLHFLAWLENPQQASHDRRREANRRRQDEDAWSSDNRRHNNDRRAQNDALPDRRRNKRVPYQVTILFFDKNGRMFQGFTHDLSVQGMRVGLKNTPQDLAPGTTGHVGFPATSADKKFPCRIIWTDGADLALEIIDYRSGFGVLTAEVMMQQAVAKQLIDLG